MTYMPIKQLHWLKENKEKNLEVKKLDAWVVKKLDVIRCLERTLSVVVAGEIAGWLLRDLLGQHSL